MSFDDPGPSLIPVSWSTVFALIFVLALPTFNLLFVVLVSSQLGILEITALPGTALRMFAMFGLAYALILSLPRLFPLALSEEKFWPQLILHIGAVFFASQVLSPIPAYGQFSEFPQPSVTSVVYTVFQITLYLVAKTYIVQREHYLATQLNLRRAQLNMLRSQSNPHFLFNTLNLLASEIRRNPTNAQELVYDLADLLRESMQAAESEFISLDEELRLATLYLDIQKRRFPERLAFNMDIELRCRQLMVPSLLLQPVIENVIKHVVSHSDAKTSLVVRAYLREDNLLLVIQDNGPQIDTNSLVLGEGLRILHETLKLHYPKQANVDFTSTEAGCQVLISLPAGKTVPGG